MKHRGLTLIEMTVVILILAMLAALVMPNLVALRASRDRYDLEAAILRAPLEAKNEARRSGLPVTLRVDGDSLAMERQPTEEEGDPTEIERIGLDGELRVENARMGSEPSDLASWRWTVYPDGTADSGALEFTDGAARKSLALSEKGRARWVQGEMPEPEEERWQAGELEQRGG